MECPGGYIRRCAVGILSVWSWTENMTRLYSPLQTPFMAKALHLVSLQLLALVRRSDERSCSFHHKRYFRNTYLMELHRRTAGAAQRSALI